MLQGSHIITALRPVEHLESILSTGLGADSDLVASYFQQYGVLSINAYNNMIIFYTHSTHFDNNTTHGLSGYQK